MKIKSQHQSNKKYNENLLTLLASNKSLNNYVEVKFFTRSTLKINGVILREF